MAAQKCKKKRKQLSVENFFAFLNAVLPQNPSNEISQLS